ncbi:MAG: hypothetical protein HKN19_02630 [Halioglobus sp.]|nr:hypothetical protein [Halioglobus sp.]
MPGGAVIFVAHLHALLVPAWRRGARWLLLLTPLELVYCCAVRIRRWCYSRGLFSVQRLPVPVVVVGNITVGGTG